MRTSLSAALLDTFITGLPSSYGAGRPLVARRRTHTAVHVRCTATRIQKETKV